MVFCCCSPSSSRFHVLLFCFVCVLLFAIYFIKPMTAVSTSYLGLLLRPVAYTLRNRCQPCCYSLCLPPWEWADFSMLNRFIFVILIFSGTEEEHVQHVCLVLQLLIENRLFVKAEMCEFHFTPVPSSAGSFL